MNCSAYAAGKIAQCALVSDSVGCGLFETNLCTETKGTIEQLCNDGLTEINSSLCYCDSQCFAKSGLTYTLIFLGCCLLFGISCVLLRRCNKVPDEKVEETLRNADDNLLEPNVTKRSFMLFRWIPFAASMIICCWFIASTAIVILWAPAANNTVGFQTVYIFMSTFLMMFWLGSNISLILNALRGLWLMDRAVNDSEPVVHSGTVSHIVVLPNYKEDSEMMGATIARLGQQEFIDVKNKVTIVLAMEQGEHNYLEKGLALRKEWLPVFRDVIITAHPKGIPGEQPGKSSNMVWAYRCLKGLHSQNNGKSVGVSEVLETTVAGCNFNMDENKTVVTLMDADALCHSRFLSHLSKQFEESQGVSKHTKFWQCPVAFYQNLGEIDFINRASTIVFAFNELANAGGFVDLGLFGYNPRVPVNTYSMSWKLLNLIKGGDTFVVADESHNLFKAMHLTHGVAELEPIFLPISVYSVTSDKFVTGFINRFTQIKRWMYGNGWEFSFWNARYSALCSKSLRWNGVRYLDILKILWRLFIFSSINLVQPLFFCIYGFLWAIMMGSPTYKILAQAFVTIIMTLFMVINVSLFVSHWKLVSILKIDRVTAWPTSKKVLWTIFDAIIGVGAATVFYVLIAGLAANWQLLTGAGLTWGTEGRAQNSDENKNPDKKLAELGEVVLQVHQKADHKYDKRHSLKKSRSSLTIANARKQLSARRLSQMSEKTEVEPIIDRIEEE